MGDSPEFDSTLDTMILENHKNDKIAALAHVRQEMRDISKFNYLVYDEVTSYEQDYTLSFKVMPGESSTLILRQIRGGGLDKLRQFRKGTKFSMQVDKAHIRVVHTQAAQR